MQTKSKNTRLILPYGGRLVNLVAAERDRDALMQHAIRLPSIQISVRSMFDLELLATGAFSPLDRFMGENDYRSVLREMRLADGRLFPLPITLPVNNIEGVKIGDEVVLRGPTNEVLAVMRLEEVFTWDLHRESSAVFGTTDSRNPLVSEMHRWGRYYLSGPLSVLNLPRHHDFPDLRKTPAEVRALLDDMGHPTVLAYQPQRPMNRSHEAFIQRIVTEADGSLLVQPLNNARYHDVKQFTLIRCFKALMDNYYDPGRTILNMMPLVMHAPVFRTGLWHAIINRNYGANRLIINCDQYTDHKYPNLETSSAFRDPMAPFREYEAEIGVRMVPCREMIPPAKKNRFEESEHAVSGGAGCTTVSSTDPSEDGFVHYKNHQDLFSYPEIAQILYQACTPRTQQGFCIWLTGLPCSGKSTVANILMPLLMARGKKVTFLDGDEIRTHLSQGLGFSKEDRIANILRVGFIAAEVVRHEGVVICALISPYAAARDKVRTMVGDDRFLEIFIETPVEVCRVRDVKGMYTMAAKGKIKAFTGHDDVYEPPVSPELRISTKDATPKQSAGQIMQLLTEKGFFTTEGGEADLHPDMGKKFGAQDESCAPNPTQ